MSLPNPIKIRCRIDQGEILRLFVGPETKKGLKPCIVETESSTIGLNTEDVKEVIKFLESYLRNHGTDTAQTTTEA